MNIIYSRAMTHKNNMLINDGEVERYIETPCWLSLFDVYPVVAHPCSFFQLYFIILWQQIKRKVVVYKKVKYTDNSLMLQMEKMAHFIKKGKAQFIMK